MEGAADGADVTAWGGLGLGARVLGTLAKLGFEQPTPIQAECLPAAIRDRRDIIGAAQTVRATWCPAHARHIMPMHGMCPLSIGDDRRKLVEQWEACP